MPKVRVTITLDESVLRRIDSARGSTSRSEYIERVLAEHLGLPAAPPRAACPEERAVDGSRELEVLEEILRELREIRRLLSSGAAVRRPEEPPAAGEPSAKEGPASLPSFAVGNPWLEVLGKRGR